MPPEAPVKTKKPTVVVNKPLNVPNDEHLKQAQEELEKTYQGYRIKFVYHRENVLRFRVNKHAENNDIVDSQFLKVRIEKDGVVVENMTILPQGKYVDLQLLGKNDKHN